MTNHYTLGLSKWNWSILAPGAGSNKSNDDPISPGQYQPYQSSTRKSARLHRKRNLLAYAVEFNLQLFVKEWLLTCPDEVRRTEGAPLLYHALSPVISIELIRTTRQSYYSMLELLLEAGADPNQEIQSWKGDTVWRKMVLCIALPRRSAFHLLAFEGEAEQYGELEMQRDFLEQDGSYIRRLFWPLAAWLRGIPDPENSESIVQECVSIVELMLHYNADPSAVPRFEFWRMLPMLCEQCQAMLDGKAFDDGPEGLGGFVGYESSPSDSFYLSSSDSDYGRSDDETTALDKTSALASEGINFDRLSLTGNVKTSRSLSV